MVQLTTYSQAANYMQSEIDDRRIDLGMSMQKNQHFQELMLQNFQLQMQAQKYEHTALDSDGSKLLSLCQELLSDFDLALRKQYETKIKGE